MIKIGMTGVLSERILSSAAHTPTCSPLLLPKEDICRQRLKEGLRLGGVGEELRLLLPCLAANEQEDVLLCYVIMQCFGQLQNL